MISSLYCRMEFTQQSIDVILLLAQSEKKEYNRQRSDVCQFLDFASDLFDLFITQAQFQLI
jgi:hypothetical protein